MRTGKGREPTEEDAEPPAGDAGDCVRCGAVLPGASAFCEECGTPVEGPSAVAARRATTPAERHEATRRIRQGVDTVRYLRNTYRILSVLAGAGLAFLVYLRFTGVFSGPDSILMIAGVAATFLWVLAASVITTSHPLLCGAVLAAIATLGAAVATLDGPSPRSLIRMWFAVVALWGGVVPLFRLQALLREYPDLFLVRQFKGSLRGRAHGATVMAIRERARKERAAVLRKVLTWGGGAVLAAGILAGILSAAVRTPPVDPAAAGFAAAWEGHRWEEIRGMFDPSSRDRLGDGLERLLRRRGWDSSPPALGEPRITERGERGRRAVFDAPGGEVTTTWEYRGDRWVLVGLRFPER